MKKKYTDNAITMIYEEEKSINSVIVSNIMSRTDLLELHELEYLFRCAYGTCWKHKCFNI